MAQHRNHHRNNVLRGEIDIIAEVKVRPYYDNVGGIMPSYWPREKKQLELNVIALSP